MIPRPMQPAHIIEIQTPKKFLLNGLWFGPTKPKKVIIWVHGLSSSAFSKLGIVEQLIDKDTAVMTFNNRGSSTVTRTRLINVKKKDGYDFVLSGGAHEVFTESADDIQGAVDFARKNGAQEIYLAGQSTGCQKITHYATRKGNEAKIKGVILLAPLSDYSLALHSYTKRELTKATQVARSLVRKGKKHAIIPGWWMDAQRFLSLNTPRSSEEIFSYVSPQIIPRTYRALRTPAFILLAGADEYGDRPAKELGEWFKRHSRSKRFKLQIIPKVPHSFRGGEKQIAKAVRAWIQG